MKDGRLDRVLSQSEKLGLDTAVMIYHFEGRARYASLTSLIFKAVADGLEAVLSSLAVMEILVKPFQSAPPKTLDGLIGQLQSMPNFTFVAPEFAVAVEAARLRAKYGLRTVDALHLATGLQGGADTFITNDKDFARVDGREKIRIVMLEDCV